MSNERMPESLDRAVAAIRAEAVDPDALAGALKRAHSALAAGDAGAPLPAGDIRGCADVQALLSAYLERRLAETRRLLVEDHSRECLACRRALNRLRAGATATAAATAPARVWPRALAAALVLAVATGTLWLGARLYAPAGDLARVESVESALIAVADGAALATGQTLAAHQAVRTARGGGALLRLPDGTLVELAERTELALSRRSDGTSIDLARGRIIIEAARQKQGHLYVHTDDCQVAVTGTVLAVTRGIKGSRVSVLEGRVEVDDGGGERVLTAGEQHATGSSVGAVPLERDVAWSRRLDRHLALLKELSDLGREIDESVSRPAPRHASRLLDLVPADTVLYAAVPNLSRSLSEAHALFRRHLEQSPALKDWWPEESQVDAGLSSAIEHMSELGGYLGDEIVLAAAIDERGRPSHHLLLAEVAKGGLAAALEQAAADLAEGHGGLELVVVEDPSLLAVPESRHDGTLWVWLRPDLVAASNRPESLRALAAAIDRGTEASFAATPFHQRIAEAYGDGLSWLVAADLKAIQAHAAAADASADGQRERRAAELAGFSDATYLVATQSDEGDRSRKEALVTFAGERRGVASWLAPPSAMAGLEFLAPDPTLVAAFVVKDPALMLEDLLSVVTTLDPQAEGDIAFNEQRLGLRRDDLARPLGGEVAFALEPPVLPNPSWKVVVEVYDAPALVAALERLVEGVNARRRSDGESEAVLETSDLAGHTVHRLHLPGCGLEAQFLFHQGYLVAGPSRAVLERALEHQRSGVSFARSPRLSSLFPEDGYTSFSALLYQDVGGSLAQVAGRVLGASAELSDGQRRTLADIAAQAAPTLFVGYAEPDRIRLVGNGRANLLGIDLRTLLSMPALFELGASLEGAAGAAGEQEP